MIIIFICLRNSKVRTKLLRRCCGVTCCKEKSKQEYKKNMHMRFHLHGDEKRVESVETMTWSLVVKNCSYLEFQTL